MKYNNLLIIIIFLVCSCSKRNNDNGINLNDKGRLFISQIADSVSYIHLEMNEQCLLGDISDLLFQKNIYYVFDGQTNSIYLFDEKGFFVNKIFKQGRGPGEYVHPSSFFIDPEDNIHIIDLLLKKILVYDNKGDFLDEFWIEEYVRDFCVINDKYFFYMPDQNINSKQGLYLYDTKNKQYEEFIKIKGTSKSFMPWYITSLGGNDSYSVVDPVNNYVYYFNYTGVFETKKFIFFPLADDVKNEDMNAFSLVFFNESNCFMMWTFASVMYENGMKIYLYNKNNLQGKVYDTVINDLDNRELGIPTRYSNNNKFIFWMHSDNEDNNPILQILHLKQ